MTRPRGIEGWGQLFVSFGLAATITSTAGVVNELLATRKQRCLLSQQIVGDETPNPGVKLERPAEARRAR